MMTEGRADESAGAAVRLYGMNARSSGTIDVGV